MVVLGVAPGLSELAYAVLAYHSGALQADPVDSDVLHAGRGPVPTSIWQITTRSRVHHMLLGIVCERHTPALMVLGPAVKPKEPIEHVQAVRLILRAIAAGLHIPVVELPEKADMLLALGADQRSWRRAVTDGLRQPLASQDRRIVLATASAIAGVRSYRKVA